ncbi:HAMP domain-containing sensor histidine kinase [Phytohabitans suffuscus]
MFWRIFLLNAAVLVAAAVLLALSPVTVSTPVLPAEAVILAAGLAAMLLANAALVRIGLAPLRRLTRTMATIDLLRPGPRPEVTGHAGIADLIRTFNAMLDRLEAERATSAARALSAQEGERRRIARELHDEVGQTLTAVVLELKRVADRAPEPLRGDLLQARETTRDGLDEIRRIARRLRPGVLEELGLVSALRALAAEVSRRGGAAVRQHFDGDLSGLDEEAELVVYRVAQEALTNTARHAGASRVDLALRRTPAGAELCVGDDGKGLGAAAEGAGIRGMRERALLVGATLTVGRGPDGGTEVRLALPLAAGARPRSAADGGAQRLPQ